MKQIVKHSIEVSYEELAKFLKIDHKQIKGGYFAPYSKFVEVYLNE